MAHIYYAMSGEGRGHATRARAVIEALRPQHRVTVYAYHQSHDILSPVYRDTDVTVRAIPGLQFRYSDHGRLDYLRSFLQAVPFVAQLPANVRRVREDMERDQPALVITDFEPIIPRAALQSKVPFISLDHQHFLTAYDLSSLPFKLRAYAAFLGPWVHAFYRGQIRTMVSSFYNPPLKSARGHVSRVGVLLRPEILEAKPETRSHLVAYLRRQVPAQVLDALSHYGDEVRIYGLGAQPRRGNLVFQEVDIFRFVEDLATCRALVCTAGNQLVGEALYLDKPVLAMPEVGNFEQAINGHFLARSGTGLNCDPLHLTGTTVRNFVERLDEFRTHIDPNTVCGNSAALALIDHHLQQLLDGESWSSEQERGANPGKSRVGPANKSASTL